MHLSNECFPGEAGCEISAGHQLVNFSRFTVQQSCMTGNFFRTHERFCFQTFPYLNVKVKGTISTANTLIASCLLFK